MPIDSLPNSAPNTPPTSGDDNDSGPHLSDTSIIQFYHFADDLASKSKLSEVKALISFLGEKFASEIAKAPLIKTYSKTFTEEPNESQKHQMDKDFVDDSEHPSKKQATGPTSSAKPKTTNEVTDKGKILINIRI